MGGGGDVWIVTTPASSPAFTFLGYLSAENIAAAQQPPYPTAPNVPKPAAPPGGAPPLPPPVLPQDPQTAPGPFGALGGGLIIPDPNKIPAVYPVGPGGMQFVVPPPSGLPPYYMIPIFLDGEVRFYPRPGGLWAYGYVLPIWALYY